MKADLHVHTNHTDCTDSPEEVFQKAKANGVTMIAITDHDTTYGFDINQQLAKKYDIEYIPAIEISAYDYKNNRPCHIVGLYVKEGYEPLEAMIAKTTKARHEHSRLQIEKLIQLGYDISLDDFKDKRGVHGIYKQHIMDVLMTKRLIDEPEKVFYKRMFKGDGPLAMKIDYPCALEATKILRQSGALPVLAHPTLYKNLEILPELVANGLKGIEASYPFLTSYKEATDIELLAKEYGLFLSAGSDYHGGYSDYEGNAIGSHYVTELNI